jgi:hypothetical protein
MGKNGFQMFRNLPLKDVFTKVCENTGTGLKKVFSSFKEEGFKKFLIGGLIGGGLSKTLDKQRMEKATPQQIMQTSGKKIRDLTDKAMNKEKFNLNKDEGVTTYFKTECERLVTEMILKYEDEMLKEIKDISIDPKNYYILVQHAFAD